MAESSGRSETNGRVGGRRQEENQLVFAQRKLEENYAKVLRRLTPWRSAILAGQEVLVWRRPLLAIVLYLVVHLVFYHYATSTESYMSQLCSLVFWCLMGDAIWRAATRDGQGVSGGGDSTADTSSTWRSRLGNRLRTRRQAGELSDVVAFERALLLSNEERNAQQLVPFEVVCLNLAKIWMWIDNIWLALRHWSTNDPIMFGVSLGVPGVVLIIVGHYISTIVILYVLVMGVIVWPYISYHDLIQKTSDLISTHFPVLIQRALAFQQFIKTLLTKDERVLSEFSLVRGGGGGGGDEDLDTEEMLANELSLLLEPHSATRDQQQGQPSPMEGERRREGESGRGNRRRRVRQRAAVRRADPGMSVLQDSVLGMPSDAFQEVEDSVAMFGPGPGEFPSISNLDQSLLLPQFPPEEGEEAVDGQPTHSVPPNNLSTIQEAEEVLPDSLEDAIEDSVNPEFGLNSQLISRRYSATHADSAHSQRPHPPVGYSTSAPPVTSFGPSTSSLSSSSTQGQLGRQTPPPSYEDALSMSPEGSVIQAGSYGFETPGAQPVLGGEKIAVRHRAPRNSSTPFIRGEPQQQ